MCVCVCAQGANKHSWHAALSLAAKAEVVEKSWKITLATGVLCVWERDKDGNRGSDKSMINNYKADMCNKALCLNGISARRVVFLMGLISLSANISFNNKLNNLRSQELT